MELAEITHVRHVGNLCLELTFADGTRGEVDLRGQIVGRGGMFEQLEDSTYFATVRVDAEAGTIAWPNGVDLDPDVLHSMVTGEPLDLAERTPA